MRRWDFCTASFQCCVGLPESGSPVAERLWWARQYSPRPIVCLRRNWLLDQRATARTPGSVLGAFMSCVLRAVVGGRAPVIGLVSAVLTGPVLQQSCRDDD